MRTAEWKTSEVWKIKINRQIVSPADDHAGKIESTLHGFKKQKFFLKLTVLGFQAALVLCLSLKGEV